MGETGVVSGGRLGADAWTERLPTWLHWVLTLVTCGLWWLVWRRPARLWGPATLGACCLFLSFADWDIWPLGFVFMVPLMHVAERVKTTREAFWWSLWTGWVANYGGFYWISGLLLDFGQMPWAAATAICLLMNLYQGIGFAIFGALFHWLRRRHGLPAVFLAPVLWATVEMVFPVLFPYYLGNSQYTFPPMIQVAELLGPLGVGAVLLAFNGGLHDVLEAQVFPATSREGGLRSGGWSAVGWWPSDEAAEKRRAWIAVGVGAALVAANLVYGVVRMGQVDAQMEAAEKLKIGLVEADIGIFSKEDPEKLPNNLIIHQQLSQKMAQEDEVDLLVWPESSFQADYVVSSSEPTEGKTVEDMSWETYRRFIPRDATWLRPASTPLLENDAADIANKTPLQDRHAVQRGFEVPVLFGAVTFHVLSEEEMKTNPPKSKIPVLKDGEVVWERRTYRIYNTAVLIDEVGRLLGTYDKSHLLAFGEYIPMSDTFPWLYDLIPAASEFTPGTEVKVLDFKGHRVGVMICYEDILPGFGRRLAAEGPEVIINVTNDAWFGKTSEPYLHLALATFRAVETRKWLLRSTNTGVSAFVDANGRVVAQTSIYDPETLAREVPMMTGGPTLYVMMGDVVGGLSLLLVCLLLGLGLRREVPRVAEGEAEEASRQASAPTQEG